MVASFCQLLQRRYAGQLDERADQYIYFAVDGAQRMQRLINDLLAFSRIGRMTTGFTDIDLNRIVDDIIGQRGPSGGAITRDELPVVRGEEPLLSALLNNLVANSVKFRRPEVPPLMHIGAERVGDEWQLYVRDNGIGIGPEFVDKVFVIFQRLHSKEAYPGTGIGLAIGKKIVEYHAGRIWVDTEYRDGTLIRFTLPAIAPEAELPSSPVSGPADEAGSLDAAGSADASASAGPADEAAPADEAGPADTAGSPSPASRSDGSPPTAPVTDSRVEEPAS
jgi:light-regulated signal transduction histidine kinase (bacteriophytochrome)